jgi:hypothetical protein
MVTTSLDKKKRKLHNAKTLEFHLSSSSICIIHINLSIDISNFNIFIDVLVQPLLVLLPQTPPLHRPLPN